MEFSIKNGNPEKQRNACVIVGVFEHRKLSEAASAIDHAAEGYLATLLRRGDMDGKLGSTLLVHNVPGTLCERVLLVGCGKEREFHDRAYRQAVQASVKALDGTGASDAARSASFMIVPIAKQFRPRSKPWMEPVPAMRQVFWPSCPSSAAISVGVSSRWCKRRLIPLTALPTPGARKKKSGEVCLDW
jgi:hypothetical protein